MKDMAQIIADQPFFANMSLAYRDLIAGCGSLAVYQRGQFISRAGDDAAKFFLIRAGSAAVELDVPGAEVFRFQTLGENEIIGWSWLLAPYKYQFDTRALEKTRVFAFDAICLRGKCEENAELGYLLMKRFSRVMVRRLAATRMQLIDVYGKRKT